MSLKTLPDGKCLAYQKLLNMFYRWKRHDQTQNTVTVQYACIYKGKYLAVNLINNVTVKIVVSN